MTVASLLERGLSGLASPSDLERASRATSDVSGVADVAAAVAAGSARVVAIRAVPVAAGSSDEGAGLE